MTPPRQAERLRIFVGELDRHAGRPLVEVLVYEAKAAGLAGATVLRGLMGYGANSLVHTSKILRLSENLPMVVEIVDEPAKIDAFLPRLDELMDEGLATREPVEVVFYRHR
ncbi:MAG: DUF190 domain-containing protein [Desulfovibrionaceae bacterium]